MRMDELSKSELLGDLYAYYGPLLTKGQQAYFEEYYYDDLSLSEIAENHGVSRAAVYDNLKRSSRLLEKYDRLLGLKEKDQALLAELQVAQTAAEKADLTAVKTSLAQLADLLT
jgi:predicted DNA-binding protein YlxM (UPF0122 family)